MRKRSVHAGSTDISAGLVRSPAAPRLAAVSPQRRRGEGGERAARSGRCVRVRPQSGLEGLTRGCRGTGARLTKSLCQDQGKSCQKEIISMRKFPESIIEFLRLQPWRRRQVCGLRASGAELLRGRELGEMSPNLTANPSISLMVKWLGLRGVEGLLLLLFIILRYCYSFIHSEAAFQRLRDQVRTEASTAPSGAPAAAEGHHDAPRHAGGHSGRAVSQVSAVLPSQRQRSLGRRRRTPGARIAPDCHQLCAQGLTAWGSHSSCPATAAGTTELQWGRWLLWLPKQDEAYLGAGTLDGAKGASERRTQVPRGKGGGQALGIWPEMQELLPLQPRASTPSRCLGRWESSCPGNKAHPVASTQAPLPCVPSCPRWLGTRAVPRPQGPVLSHTGTSCLPPRLSAHGCVLHPSAYWVPHA